MVFAVGDLWEPSGRRSGTLISSLIAGMHASLCNTYTPFVAPVPTHYHLLLQAKKIIQQCYDAGVNL